MPLRACLKTCFALALLLVTAGSSAWAQCPGCGVCDKCCGKTIIRKVKIGRACFLPGDPPRAPVTGVTPFITVSGLALPINLQVAGLPQATAGLSAPPAQMTPPAGIGASCAGSADLQNQVTALQKNVADIADQNQKIATLLDQVKTALDKKADK